MTSKYVDTMAIMQVIGCIYKFPYLLDQTDNTSSTKKILQKDFISLYLELFII